MLCPGGSELNEVLFGNAYLSTDNNGFVFRIQVRPRPPNSPRQESWMPVLRNAHSD